MYNIEVLVNKNDIFKEFICPRCGDFGVDLKRGAISRYADVKICDKCGTDEALRDFAGNPFTDNDWFIMKNKLRDGFIFLKE